MEFRIYAAGRSRLQDAKNSHAVFLVAELNGHIIASGGVSYYQREDQAVLCFGLVHPEHQGKGVGTALLLARLALLHSDFQYHYVLIFAVAKSIDFYGRFGFRVFGQWRDKSGAPHPAARLFITSAETRRCRRLPADHGISVPSDEHRIPLRTKQDQPAQSETLPLDSDL